MFWIYTSISAVLTFVTILLAHRRLSKMILKIGKYHVHHSVNGVVLVILGFIHYDVFMNPVTAIGMGMYISHVFEEMIIERRKFLKAVRIFATPINENKEEKALVLESQAAPL